DAALRTQMRVELSSLHAELGATMVYVTHDQVEAMTMASRIVVLNQGIIEQVGSPLELYRNPDNLFVAGFLGAPRMNFLGVTLDAVNGRSLTVSAPGLAPLTVELAQPTTLPKGTGLTLGVRPEAISMVAEGSGEGAVHGEVRLVEHLGRETILYVDAGNLRTIASESGTGNITSQLSYVAPFAAGQKVALKLETSELYLFSPDGGRTISARKTILDR
ncbi:TOBE domain-containing protein, partial [Rhizobium sp. Pop5]